MKDILDRLRVNLQEATVLTERLTATLAGDGKALQRRCAEWRQKRYPNSTAVTTTAKLLEEAGEVARAVIGNAEGRTDRGDAVQEAAQVMLVLFSLVGWWYPDRDLLAAMGRELAIAEAELACQEAAR